MTPFLDEDLKRDEDAAHIFGHDFHAFQDTAGVWTCGYGHAYVEPGTVWTQAHADDVFVADKGKAIDALDLNFPPFALLSDPRQDVLVNMCFQLGWHGLSKFTRMLAAVTEGNFSLAAEEMLDSNWHVQTPKRAERLASQMSSGLRAETQEPS